MRETCRVVAMLIELARIAAWALLCAALGPGRAFADPPELTAPARPARSAARAPHESDAGEAAEGTYGARGRTKRVPAGARRLDSRELRDVPSSLGDPWRAIEVLPGAVPVLSGLPYFYLRGSPPSGTAYIYDDIPVPALYHLGLGPAVIHPCMLGELTLYSGAAPAQYGRATGGVVVAGAPESNGRRLEAELRLVDVSAFGQAAAIGGSVTGAVRYGYPALVLSVASPRVALAYWDYQLRYVAAVSKTERVELVALGSHDALQVREAPQDSLALSYHRFEARYVRRLGQAQLGAALLAGWEESALAREVALTATRVGPRLWFESRWVEGHRLRLSTDMQAIAGHVRQQDTGSEWIHTDGAFARTARSRSIWGLQGELSMRIAKRLELLLGVRGDTWLQQGHTQIVLDPRLRVITHLSDRLRLHVAGGATHQPAVPFLPLPGLSDLPLTADRLQSALQSEAGATWDVSDTLRIELQGFFHRYRDLVFTDVSLLSDVCNGRAQQNLSSVVMCRSDFPAPDRVNGHAYGTELFVRLMPAASTHLSGFLSYTLAFAAIEPVAGLTYTPAWDVRHVANLIAQWRIAGGLIAGIRWLMRSGKMHGEYSVEQAHLARLERRLPWFTRLDLEIAYSWRTSWGRMRLAAEALNVTLAQEPTELMCSGSPRICQTRYMPPIALPNLGLRGELN